MSDRILLTREIPVGKERIYLWSKQPEPPPEITVLVSRFEGVITISIQAPARDEDGECWGFAEDASVAQLEALETALREARLILQQDAASREAR